jgi:hypothetical protein
MQTNAELIAQAASNAHNLNLALYRLIDLFGKQAVIVQGERRFITRRFLNKVYLMDRRLIDRRSQFLTE